MAKYVDNKRLYEEMKTYLIARRTCMAEGLEVPKIPEFVGRAILLIGTHFATKPSYSGYTWKEDMIGEGVENCIKYINNFNYEKYNNPLAYFTQIFRFAFLRKIASEKKESSKKQKCLDDVLHQNYNNIENISDYIESL